MWETITSQLFIIGLLTATVRIATPILLCAIGEVIVEKSGVLNIGLEGMMLTGSLFGFLVTHYMGNPWLGILAGTLAGGVISLIHAYLSVTLGTNQVVNGFAINIFAWGLTSLIFVAIFGIMVNPPSIEPLGLLSIPVLSDIPFIGPILFQQSPLVYITFLIVVICSIFMFKTDAGLALQAVGEHPAAADAAGIDVIKTRYIAIIAAGMLAGLGGAFLSVTQLGTFSENMTAGRGFIAIAIVIFGRWNFFGVLLGSLLIGFATGLQLSIQALGFEIPYQFLLMLPYVLTMIALVAAVDKYAGPASLTLPYNKD